MDQIQETIRQLTGAINAQIELVKTIDHRLQEVEKRLATPPTSSTQNGTLQAPRNEAELKEIWKLPDSVRELQPFDGNPVHYISWIHTVEDILKDHEIVRGKPIYRAILQSIRSKIRGPADTALISYNIFSDDWPAIKKCLSLHYADKRDVRTLEHQLNLLQQGNMSLDEFYANVNHQFSLIVNKVKTEDYSSETIKVLIETYRNRALDVFVRGLNGDLSKMLMIQKPQTLPEAYSSCLEIQNLNFRNVAIRKPHLSNSVTAPINQFFSYNPNYNKQSKAPPRPAQQVTSRNLPLNQKNEAYNIQHGKNVSPPPRPIQPKPPVPMEVDKSLQTRQIDYINRPGYNQSHYRRYNNSENYPRKQQRVIILETEDEPSYEDYVETRDDEISEECLQEVDDENPELNFMTEASLAFHT